MIPAAIFKAIETAVAVNDSLKGQPPTTAGTNQSPGMAMPENSQKAALQGSKTGGPSVQFQGGSSMDMLTPMDPTIGVGDFLAGGSNYLAGGQGGPQQAPEPMQTVANTVMEPVPGMDPAQTDVPVDIPAAPGGPAKTDRVQDILGNVGMAAHGALDMMQPDPPSSAGYGAKGGFRIPNSAMGMQALLRRRR